MERIDIGMLYSYRDIVRSELAEAGKPPLKREVYRRVMKLIEKNNDVLFVGVSMCNSKCRTSFWAVDKNGGIDSETLRKISIGSIHMEPSYERLIEASIPQIEKNLSAYQGSFDGGILRSLQRETANSSYIMGVG